MATLNDKLIAEFHVGDTVRIRTDIDENDYVPLSFTEDMKRFRGQYLKVVEREDTGHLYDIDDFKFIRDTLQSIGFDYSGFEDVGITRYRLEDEHGFNTGYVWSIFMFDLNGLIDNNEYELEELDVLFA